MDKKNSITIKLKSLDYVYGNLPSAVTSIVALSLIITYSFYDYVEHQSLLIWLSLQILVGLFRLFSLYRYRRCKRVEEMYAQYYFIFYVGLLCSSLLWGLSAFYIFPTEPSHQMLLVLILGGLSSGSAVSTASRREFFYTYFSLSMLPVTYVFYSADTPVSNSIVSVLLLYMVLLLVIANKITDNVNENIFLADDKEKLIEKLERNIIEVKSAMEAKSKFLSMMSHEIRTPLNAIIGFNRLLKADEKDKTKLRYLQTIDNSSSILLNVLNDVLDIGKIESGKFSIEKVDFDPKVELNSLFELFTQNANDKGIRLINSISSDLPTMISCDKLRLSQVISNLLSNAIKFTDAGKAVELSVEYKIDRSTLVVKVRDEGIGIAQENLGKVLEDFTQADDSTARQFGGTGLGLPISNKLLQLMESSLVISSELNVGSIFSFELKVEASESVDEDEEDEEITFNAQKVLLAEDNKTNQMLIEILLEDLNLDVTIANDGLEAVDMYQKASYDLVLMDINMPNKNGLEAMQEIHIYEQKENIKTPVIALTANAISGDKESYIKEGFDEYLAKPIDNKALKQLLKSFFA